MSTNARRWTAIVILLAALAFGIKIVLAYTTVGTNDVLYWQRFLLHLQQDGALELYRRPVRGFNFFNHPPFMIHALNGMSFLVAVTGVPFPFWLRLPAIVADAGSVFLLWKLHGARQDSRFSPVAVALVAASPISLMVSGFHGNTDPVMIFFLLLSVYWLSNAESSPPAWLAGAAFGMSMNIKIVPILFLPLLLLHLPDTRQRLKFLSAAAVIFFVLSLPFMVQDPVAIARRVLGYGGIPGHWGVTRLLGLLFSYENPLFLSYAVFGKWILLALLLLASWWLSRPERKGTLLQRCGAIAFGFMTLSPGFGVQYLAWLVPWVAGIELGAGALFYLAAGVFLFSVYTYWSRGLPWYLANSDAVGNWRGETIIFELICWMSVVFVTYLFFKRLAAAPERPTTSTPLARDD